MKTLKDFWCDFFSRYQAGLLVHYPGLELRRFLLEVSDCLGVSLENSLHSLSRKSLRSWQEKFLEGIPFAYLTKFSEFYFQRFYIDERVLIPRNETEHLVDLIVRESGTFERACDIGTGSGVILLSLLHAQKVKTGLGVDLSQDALDVASINARRLRLKERASFKLADRLSGVAENFDLIVSNPPYIKASAHRKLVHDQVHRFEPHSALYLSDTEYEAWFHDFFTQIRQHLKPGGLFYMEGHELEVEQQVRVLKDLGFSNVQVLQDYAGLNRFLRAKLS